MYAAAEVFRPLSDRGAAREAFAKSVSRVEIETHSYCNRRCNYCPNVVGDRLGDYKQMRPEHWKLIVDNLAEIDYAGNLVFQSYNEPLADRAIVDRLREARAAAPRARLMTYTNGDYLDAEYLQALSDAGLDYMHVSIHTRYNGKYSEVDALNLIAKLVGRLKSKIRYKQVKAGSFIVAQIPHSRIEIEVRAINYFEHGNDRGGLVEVVKKPPTRTAPCHFPFAHFYVGFSGNVTPCCHIRSDSPAHADHLFGNLDDFGSIFEAWAGQVGAAWRRALITPLAKGGPCEHCVAPFLGGDPKALTQARQIWERHVRDGVLQA